MPELRRREVLVGSAALLAAGPAFAQATVAGDKTIAQMFVGRTIAPGKVKLNIPPFAENGNAIQLTVEVEEAAAAVKRLVLVAPGNPFPFAGEYRFGTRAAKAQFSTRVRLAKSQTLLAVAELNDGSLWSASGDVVVTLGACAEANYGG